MDETISIVRFDTGEAVRNIQDLKDNVKALKAQLSELEIGSEDYQTTLSELKINQNALKDAMYATSSSMEDLTASATGTSESYNSLVHRMAAMKEELRATDISTTEGAQRFAELAGQINETNEKLKLLDKMQGNYQRNVGNYKSALDGLGASFASTAGKAKSLITPIAGVTSGLKALSATPAIAVLGLLANVLVKVVSGLKNSEENTNSWNRALGAFKPVADAATRTLQKLGKMISDTANWIVDLLEKWGLMTDAMRDGQALADQDAKIAQMARDFMVQNAKSAQAAAEDRAKAAMKDKYTAQQRIKFLEDAYLEEKAIANREQVLAKARYEAAKKRYDPTGNSKAENDELARLEADMYAAQTRFAQTNRRLQKELQSAKNEILNVTRDSGDGVVEEIDEVTQFALTSVSELERALKELERKEEEKRQRDAEFAKETEELFAEMDEQLALEIQEMLDEQLAAEWDAMMEERRINQMRIESFVSMASAVSNVLSSIADIYEENEEADEKAAQKAKALKTASAIISTIGGAVSAYMSTWSAAELPLTVKAILAPLNAASVLAAGYAQVKQINSVKVGGSSGSAVAVPSVASPQIQQVRSVTGQSEEERMNQIASNQRVYLVYSDVEAAQSTRKVQVQETEF